MLKNLWKFVVINQDLIYKSFLIILCSIVTVYFFPSGGKFKYNFQKGRPWQYNTLYAPFDFAILKSDKELETEKQEIINKQTNYYRYDKNIFNQVKLSYQNNFSKHFLLPASDENYNDLFNNGLNLIDQIYGYGVLPIAFENKGENIVFLIRDNKEETIDINDFFKIEELNKWVNDTVINPLYIEYSSSFYDLLLIKSFPLVECRFLFSLKYLQ